jgi:hypothetical protein
VLKIERAVQLPLLQAQCQKRKSRVLLALPVGSAVCTYLKIQVNTELVRNLANFNYLFISHEHSFAVSSILKAVAVICLLWS